MSFVGIIRVLRENYREEKGRRRGLMATCYKSEFFEGVIRNLRVVFRTV